MLRHRRHTSGQVPLSARQYISHTHVSRVLPTTTPLISAIRATAPVLVSRTMHAQSAIVVPVTASSLAVDWLRGNIHSYTRQLSKMFRGVCVAATTAHARTLPANEERRQLFGAQHTLLMTRGARAATRPVFTSRWEPREGLAEPLASALAPLGHLARFNAPRRQGRRRSTADSARRTPSREPRRTTGFPPPPRNTRGSKLTGANRGVSLTLCSGKRMTTTNGTFSFAGSLSEGAT